MVVSMRRDQLFGVLFLMLASACTSQQDKDRITQLERQNLALQDEVKRQRDVVSLDLQDKCSKQAQQQFKANWDPEGKDGSFATYTNHYNSKLKACYMSVVTTWQGAYCWNIFS
jgi:hypothetical protein